MTTQMLLTNQMILTTVHVIYIPRIPFLRPDLTQRWPKTKYLLPRTQQGVAVNIGNYKLRRHILLIDLKIDFWFLTVMITRAEAIVPVHCDTGYGLQILKNDIRFLTMRKMCVFISAGYVTYRITKECSFLLGS